MCINKRLFTDNSTVHKKPSKGFSGAVNTFYFRLNGCLPFYNKTIQKVKPDIIHAHFGYDGYRMIKPAIKNNTPFITSFYGSDVSRLPDEFDWPRRYKKLAAACDAFVAASYHMKEQLINLGFPKGKIHIIPYGLDLKNIKFIKSRPKKAPLMMVGRMVEKKGFEYAVEAVKLLADQNVKVQLNVFGDGILYEKLKKLVLKWNIEDRVTFYGYMPVKSIIEQHYKHRILLAPSVTAADGDEEGLPNTILEAMACGTPVIATDHAAISEVIIPAKTGLMVPERDAKAIASAIKTLLQNGEDFNGISTNARNLLEKNFEINKVVDKIETLYKKVIKDYAAK